MSPKELTQYIKAEACSLGFDVCGIAKAESVPQAVANYLNDWVAQGKNGEMSYLERNCEKRIDPRLLVPGCKSIICVALNYSPENNDREFPVARYALGSDYHKVVKDKLYLLLNNINKVKRVAGRPFCDSAPILERFWAQQAGIGWIGKNQQLIIPKAGSYFFLGELLIDEELEYDAPMSRNFCGNCDACIRNCPGGALSDKGIDARRCLSYLTIEYRGELPEDTGAKMGDCFYGCDKCLTHCPHNRFAKPTGTADFFAKKEILIKKNEEWRALTPEEYRNIFADSAVERCGYEQLMRNINTLKNK